MTKPSILKELSNYLVGVCQGKQSDDARKTQLYIAICIGKCGTTPIYLTCIEEPPLHVGQDWWICKDGSSEPSEAKEVKLYDEQGQIDQLIRHSKSLHILYEKGRENLENVWTKQLEPLTSLTTGSIGEIFKSLSFFFTFNPQDDKWRLNCNTDEAQIGHRLVFNLDGQLVKFIHINDNDYRSSYGIDSFTLEKLKRMLESYRPLIQVFKSIKNRQFLSEKEYEFYKVFGEYLREGNYEWSQQLLNNYRGTLSKALKKFEICPNESLELVDLSLRMTQGNDLFFTIFYTVKKEIAARESQDITFTDAERVASSLIVYWIVIEFLNIQESASTRDLRQAILPKLYDTRTPQNMYFQDIEPNAISGYIDIARQSEPEKRYYLNKMFKQSSTPDGKDLSRFFNEESLPKNVKQQQRDSLARKTHINSSNLVAALYHYWNTELERRRGLVFQNL
jgi:hypothetical protein